MWCASQKNRNKDPFLPIAAKDLPPYRNLHEEHEKITILELRQLGGPPAPPEHEN